LFVLARIPTIEAVVPTTVLAGMFGKKMSAEISKAALKANGLMHFLNFAKGTMKVFQNTAPKLGPALGLLGVGFGTINKELNSVKPRDIIKNVNKAIGKVISETNKRFEVMEEYVGQSIRKMIGETMDDDYRGQFEGWNRCLRYGTKDLVNECQRDVAHDLAALRYGFMAQKKYEDLNGIISNDDIKIIELQLPMLKKYADLHFLVLGALIKTYEDDESEMGRGLANNYKVDFVEFGRIYVSYMEWALRRIRQARLEDKPPTPQLTCQENDNELFRGLFPYTARYLETSFRKCEFKCTDMKTDYCKLESTETCSGKGCMLCRGFFCNVEDELISYKAELDKAQLKESKSVCEKYASALTQDMDVFWKKEIEVFLPVYNSIIHDLEREMEEEDQEGEEEGVKREDIPNDPKMKEEAIKNDVFNSAEFKKMNNEKKECEKEALKGTRSSQSLSEYMNIVKANKKDIKLKRLKKKPIADEIVDK